VTWESGPDATEAKTEGIDIKGSPHKVSSVPFGLRRGARGQLLTAILTSPWKRCYIVACLLTNLWLIWVAAPSLQVQLGVYEESVVGDGDSLRHSPIIPVQALPK